MTEGALHDPAFRDSLAAASRELIRCRPQVEGLAQLVEGRFTVLAEVVGELLADDAKIAKQATELEAFLRGKEALVDAYQLYKKMRDLVEANLQRTLEIDQRLADTAERLSKAQSHEDDFAEAIVLFWALTTSIRIEAASLPPEERPPILQLASSLETIHRELKSLVQRQMRRLESIREAIQRVRARVEQVRRANQRRVEQSHGRLDQTLNKFEAILERAVDLNRDVRSQDEEIRQSFNQIVVSLQFQDIVRQKLEHVLAAYDHVLGGARDGEDEVRLAASHYVARTQAELAQTAAEQIQRAAEDVTSHAQRLVKASERAGRIVTGLQSVLTAAFEQTRTASTFVENVSELQAVTVASSTIAEEVDRVVSEAQAQLVQQIASMAGFTYQLRLVGLNAQVQSARVSDGVALEELSIHTRRTSDNMRTTTESLLAEVRTVVPALEAVDRSLKDLLAMSNREQDTLNVEAKQSEQRLRRMESSLMTSFGGLEDAIGTLRSKIETTLGQSSFGDEIEQSFDECISAFRVYAEVTETLGLDHRDDPLVRERLDQLRMAYAMDSERLVHDRIAGEVRGDEPAASATPDDGAAAGGRDSDPPPGTGHPSGTTPRLDEPGRPAAAQSNDDFGDNVELF